jgi:hypothetical protein
MFDVSTTGEGVTGGSSDGDVSESCGDADAKRDADADGDDDGDVTLNITAAGAHTSQVTCAVAEVLKRIPARCERMPNSQPILCLIIRRETGLWTLRLSLLRGG